MKVLLCLLTGQHMPNLLSVHHYKPRQIVLLETPGMLKNGAGKNFLSALEKGGLHYAQDSVIEVPNEDSIKAITRVLESVYKRYEGAEWVINLTGGTKPMSIAVFEFFKDKNAQLIYINNPNPNVFLNLADDTREQTDYKPDTEAFLEGYGYEYAKKQVKIEQAEERAKSYWQLSCLLAERAEPENLFAQLEHRSLREGKVGLRPQFYQHLPEPIRDSIENTFSQAERSSGNKYMGDFLTGGWLEVFFWGVLNHHKEALGLWDVHLGIEPRKKGSRSGTNNDLDVTFMHNYTLSFIECKSGSQHNDKDNDILYKLETVRKQLGALRVKSYLATTADHILKDRQLKEAFANRASLYDCTIIVREQIHQLANDWESPEVVKQILGFR